MVFNMPSGSGEGQDMAQFRRYHADRQPIVELAAEFGLIPKDNRHEPDMQNRAYELINPLLYFDKAAEFLKHGSIKSQSGRELTADDAIAMFENYLGIVQHKEHAATLTKNLNAGLADRRAARRAQRFAEAMTHFYLLFRDLRKDAGPAFAEEVLLEILSRDNTRLAVKRYTADRKSRPDFERFKTDVTAAHMAERTDRTRALTRARVRRSRQQSRKAGDSTVQIGLRDGDGVKELNA